MHVVSFLEENGYVLDPASKFGVRHLVKNKHLYGGTFSFAVDYTTNLTYGSRCSIAVFGTNFCGEMCRFRFEYVKPEDIMKKLSYYENKLTGIWYEVNE